MLLIYIRKELSHEELRAPLVPNDIPILLNNGFKAIYIESCNKRIFKDNEYIEKGAIVTSLKWYDPLFKDALIIGLKTLDGLEYLDGHKHVYFSHTYKKQLGYEQILNRFKESGSILYDFEYFLDLQNKKRVISFGYYAGIMGGLLGILQYIEKNYYNRNLKNLKYFNNFLYNEKIDNITTYNLNVKIAIIGYRGNCGKGVRDLLDELDLRYFNIDKLSDKSGLVKDYDIIINCINLDENYNEIWINNERLNTKKTKTLIVDISCDYSKENNPIKIYDENTTWKEPVYSYNEMVDIIAINNLPSLIPENSSKYFSAKLVELLLNYNNKIWNNNEKLYYDIIISL